MRIGHFRHLEAISIDKLCACECCYHICYKKQLMNPFNAINLSFIAFESQYIAFHCIVYVCVIFNYGVFIVKHTKNISIVWLKGLMFHEIAFFEGTMHIYFWFWTGFSFLCVLTSPLRFTRTNKSHHTYHDHDFLYLFTLSKPNLAMSALSYTFIAAHNQITSIKEADYFFCSARCLFSDVINMCTHPHMFYIDKYTHAYSNASGHMRLHTYAMINKLFMPSVCAFFLLS